MDQQPVEPTPFDASTDRPPEAAAPEVVTADPLDTLRAQLAQLHARGTSGAGWFYWIAALSLVNSVILLSGGDRHFVVGLGVTLVADVVAKEVANQNPEIATVAKGIAFGFDLFVAAIVCLFGWLSRRPILPIFVVGMILYLLDGLIYLLAGEWMSVGFHAFVLLGMWSGFSAYREMKQIKAALEQRLAAGVSPSA
jgi:hypothetical protein